MDPLTQIHLTRELIDIDSTSGREGAAGTWLATLLRRQGYAVFEQPVTDGRFNVVATLETPPRVVFSTHFASLVIPQEQIWSTVTLRLILWEGLMALCLFAVGESRWTQYAKSDGRARAR